MAVRAENQHFPGVSEESLERGLEAIPNEFRLQESVPLHNFKGELDIIRAVARARQYSVMHAEDFHISLIASEVDDNGRRYFLGIDNAVMIYLRDGLTPPEPQPDETIEWAGEPLRFS